MKKCAYCPNTGSLTKEHIWPSSIIKKYDYELSTYNKKIDKLIQSEPVIKDVCATCNNVYLSKVDAYLSGLYDQHLFQCLDPGDSTSISFNYEMLLRSMLKISFNSSRAAASKEIVKAHERHSNFILNGGYVSGVQLRLLVVTSAKVMVDGVLTDIKFPVTQLRCADIPYDGVLSHRFIVRLIAINSFWFYLVLSKKPEAKHKWKEFNEGFCSWGIQPGLHIASSKTKLDIPVNQTTYMSKELMGTLWDAVVNA